jgi:uncharacterized protein (DUF433 family)
MQWHTLIAGKGVTNAKTPLLSGSATLALGSDGPRQSGSPGRQLSAIFHSGESPDCRGISMPDVVKTEHPHIVRRESVCGGEPLIDGLRVTVRHVVTLHQRGETILDIAEALGITEAQVFHALSYFFDHRDEILALVALEEQAHARFTRS